MWKEGWDNYFWTQSPNYDAWDAQIGSEAAAIVDELDKGNAEEAAVRLKEDLKAMGGDMYAQDQLLSDINLMEKKGVGADLNLGTWNPGKGTWDNMNVEETGIYPIPISTYNKDGSEVNIAVGTMTR